jgi:hypothetical protein
MTKFKTMIKKGWVVFATVALIGGSAGAMALTLGQNPSVYAAQNVAPIIDTVKVNDKDQITKNQEQAAYTLVDKSKTTSNYEENIKAKLTTKGITGAQLEKETKDVMAYLTPGTKDISEEQAVAYAAALIKKAYGVDLKGYTAEPSFAKINLPNSNVWAVEFKDPKNIQVGYLAKVNSVSGKLNDLSLRLDYSKPYNKNLDMNDPSWKQKAVEDVSALLPSTVSVINSKVITTSPIYGVTVLCKLSDGSDYVIFLYGESKEATGYYVFANGYDGSFDPAVPGK